MFKDDLGDRMKGYEKVQTSITLDASKCIYARIDGRTFSTLTKKIKMERPFDPLFTKAMMYTTEVLIKEFGADFGYVQSDEISLGWLPIEAPSQFAFDGKIQKLTSTMAAKATAAFIYYLVSNSEDYDVPKDYNIRLLSALPSFDCRIFELPSLVELYNAFVWRMIDCKRNAVSQWARSFFSHNQLNNLSTAQIIEKAEQINRHLYEISLPNRYGSFFFKKLIQFNDPIKGLYTRKKVVYINKDYADIKDYFLGEVSNVIETVEVEDTI